MAETPETSNEFRRYRQVLLGLYFAAVAAGLLLLGASVARQLLFRAPSVDLRGPRLSHEHPDPRELLRCNEDVLDLYLDLGGKVRELLAVPTTGDTGQLGARWESFSREWTTRWDEVDARCRFSTLANTNLGLAYDRMAKVHGDLPAMRLKYQSLLIRFDEEQAAELARMRRALNQSREVLQERAAQSGGEQPQ